MKTKNIFHFTTGLLLLLTGLFSGSAFAEAPKLKNLPANASVLFIQVAKGGELIPNKNSDSYSLVLKKVESFTSYFTDRPNRATGMLSTDQFVNIWKAEKDLQNSPPNVAMETSNVTDGKRINRVFVLSNPTYDSKKQEITYTAKALDKGAKANERMSIGYTVLFIDDFNWGGNKFGG